MAFKTPLSTPSIGEDRMLLQLNTCRICGDQARIRFYGALSCQSCKTFFRRNGLCPEVVRSCRNQGQCEVNIRTRHICTSCRLQKCLAVGMSSDLIRKAMAPTKKHLSKMKSIAIRSGERQPATPSSQLSSLDLLRHDRSSLSTSQWTVISNVIHAFDAYSFIPHVNGLVKSFSSSHPQRAFNTSDVLSIVDTHYTAMQSFISSTPDFQILTAGEQRSLLARNLQGVSGFSFHLLVRDTDIIDRPASRDTYDLVYGSSIMKQMRCMLAQLDTDSTLLKLLLIVLTFSSNNFVIYEPEKAFDDALVLGTFRLLGSQNMYVELLWRYMLYRYDYVQAVLRFSRMIMYVLDDIKYTTIIYLSNEAHHDLIDEAMTKSSETVLRTHSDVVSLWGKTEIVEM